MSDNILELKHITKLYPGVVALNDVSLEVRRGEILALADQPEDRGSDTEVHQVFHNNVTCVFGSCEACFYHCESGLHKEDQRGADQHPYCVYCGKFHNNIPPS